MELCTYENGYTFSVGFVKCTKRKTILSNHYKCLQKNVHMLPDREYEEEKREWHRQGCKVYLCTCFFLKTSQSTLDYQKLSLKKHKKSKKPISALHRITCLEEEPFKIWLHLLRKEGMKVIQPLLCFDRLYTIFNHQKKHAM